MEYRPSPKLKPLQEAVLAWAEAVEAVLQVTHGIVRGGQPDPALLARLLAAVETARQGCESVGTRLADDPDLSAILLDAKLRAQQRAP